MRHPGAIGRIVGAGGDEHDPGRGLQEGDQTLDQGEVSQMIDPEGGLHPRPKPLVPPVTMTVLCSDAILPACHDLGRRFE
jgi:hypothetical protein